MNIKRTSSKINYEPDIYRGPRTYHQIEPNYSVDEQTGRGQVTIKNEKKKNYLPLVIFLIIGMIIGYGLSDLTKPPVVAPIPVPVTEITGVTSVDEAEENEVDEPVEAEYDKLVSIADNCVERDDEFLYTCGGTANTGEHMKYEIKTYPMSNGDHWHTTEPIFKSVGHNRTLHYDLAPWRDNEGDKAVESWLVIKAGTSSDPDSMDVIKTTEHMNCYSKPIEESVEIPEDAEYVYIESQMNDSSGYLPLLTNDIYITVED